MSKKLGKFLLFVAATCAIATAVYYFLKKKEAADGDEYDYDDYDEFDEEDDEDLADIDRDFEERNYVPLNVMPVQTETPKKNAEKDPAYTEDYFDDDDEYVDELEAQDE